MSVAFTKEEDSESAAAALPDRPISPHPNLVTRDGLLQLEAGLASAKAAYAAAQAGDVKSDREAMSRATRDLRYYSARRASAQLIETASHPQRVTFGAAVTVARDDGRRLTYRIVGEDEADPTRGSVSYISPLAKALLGKEVGETATVGGRDLEVAAIA